MILRLTGLVVAVLALPARAQDSTWTAAQTSAWAAVQARWQAWQDDDLPGYLAHHDSTWHRWALRSSGLEGMGDIEPFWGQVKEGEETVAFRLDPVSVEVYGDGAFAAVHYVADETVRLLRERVTRDGRTLPVGHETHIPIRFSDFLVWEDGAWRTVGGYRDGSCALFRAFGTLCSEDGVPASQ